MKQSRTDPNMDVDELLASFNTGVYDRKFFNVKATMLPPAPAKEPTALERLADARLGLDVFMGEAIEALKGDLTVDQRVHVALILSYVEGLANRLDKIRVPGFVHPKKKKERKSR